MNTTLLLETTAYTLDQLIHLDAHQIALAGRSNVGKSSLVNALAGRKALAKISSTPGKTRSVNFYQVTTHSYYIVDLPGYGYARCSKEERKKWGKLLEYYLVSCTHLKALTLLLDSRLPPQKIDIKLAEFALTNNITLLPILTKSDKCSQKVSSEHRKIWKNILNGLDPIVTSSKTKLGIAELWKAMHKLAKSPPKEVTT